MNFLPHRLVTGSKFRYVVALALFLLPAWAAGVSNPLLTFPAPAIAFSYDASSANHSLTVTNLGDGPAYGVYLHADFGALAVSAASDPYTTAADPYFTLPPIPAGASHTLNFTLANPNWCAASLARTVLWQPRYRDAAGNNFAAGLEVNTIQAAADAPRLQLDVTSGSDVVQAGGTVSYRVTSAYSGATACASGTTGAIAVVDSVPPGFTVEAVDGGIWTPGSGGTGGSIAWSHAPTAILDKTITLRAPADAACGTTFSNAVNAAVTDCAACALAASAARTTAIACAASATVTAQKTVTPALCERCRNLDYVNVYDFAPSAGATLNQLVFADLAANQSFVPGSLFVVLDGMNITGCVLMTDTTPAGSLSLDFSGCPATAVAGKNLTIGYQLTITPASAPACADTAFYSWSTLTGTGPTVHSAASVKVQAPAMSLAVAGLGGRFDTGQTKTISLSLQRSSATAYPNDATLRLSNLSYRAVSPAAAICGGDVAPVSCAPTLDGSDWLWTFADGFSSAGQIATVELNVQKRCSGSSALAAVAHFDDQCNANATPDQTCAASASAAPAVQTSADLMLQIAPDSFNATQVKWKTYVTNRGNGAAFNVWVDHQLGAGLAYVTSSVSPDNGDVTTTANQDHSGGVINGATTVIGTIAPGTRREIALTANVVGGSDFTYRATSSWNVHGEDCQAPAPTVLSHRPTTVTSILVDQSVPAVLHASLDGGIFNSSDRGLSWTAAPGQPLNQRITQMVSHPSDANRLYAASYGNGLFASADKGDHWSACANTGLNAAALNLVALAIDPSARLYAATEAGVFTSPDCTVWTGTNTHRRGVARRPRHARHPLRWPRRCRGLQKQQQRHQLDCGQHPARQPARQGAGYQARRQQQTLCRHLRRRSVPEHRQRRELERGLRQPARQPEPALSGDGCQWQVVCGQRGRGVCQHRQLRQLGGFEHRDAMKPVPIARRNTMNLIAAYAHSTGATGLIRLQIRLQTLLQTQLHPLALNALGFFALVLRGLASTWELIQQRWQCRLHRFPHHFKVDVKVAVGDAVAHLHEDARIRSGLLHVVEVVGQAIRVHTGSACASTEARNLGGRSAGVNKSTRMPSSDSSSTCRPPRSNKLAPGSASTSKSRSLPSVSSPASTEPNTRGFSARFIETMRRMSARCACSACEGFMLLGHPLDKLTLCARDFAMACHGSTLGYGKL